ncbi:MAG: S9 family peptidase, partial [Lewinella sp.]|nr:S9 family peptidase [Lewinella sp.]
MQNSQALIWFCCGFLLAGSYACREAGTETNSAGSVAQKIAIHYPETFRDTTHIDVYHGRRIADPYHWLEFENSPSVKDWVTGQRLLTDTYLEQLPLRETLQQRLRQLWNHERYLPPVQRGEFYFHLKNDGLQDQDVLYRSRGLYGELETVFDPNELSLGQLHDYTFSSDGRWAAVQHSGVGSDWQEILVIDLRKGRLLEDRLRGVKYANLAWYQHGFFYSRYPEPEVWELRDLNEFHQLYYHKLGDPQAADELIFADRINPKRNVFGEMTADERYLVISLLEGPDGNAVYYRDLQQPTEDFT